MQNYHMLVKNILSANKESECVEFKHNNSDHEKIGEYISALGNSTVLQDKEEAYILWGVQDSSCELVGTTFNPDTQKIGNESLMTWLRKMVSENIEYEFCQVEEEGEKRVVLLTIKRPFGYPVKFKNDEYIRIGSHRQKLKDHPAIEKALWAKLSVASRKLCKPPKSGRIRKRLWR